MFLNIILVGIGGGIGAFLRSALSDLNKKYLNTSFPFATFIINITGSFLLGLLIGLHSSSIWRLLLGTGILGGFTTFSTFNYEAVLLIKTKKIFTFLVYYMLSTILGLLAAFAGLLF
ncbi:fluoride efflux transporter FluC [Aminipila sp.]|uniref:fluoride efflux transporter FluC n=1 Tax=Aminipila sp. TaxID=2060095 RepID=UPI00289FAB8F|nr:CrcB family protein [Aminipila sp.]